jgi:hypothetical protein
MVTTKKQEFEPNSSPKKNHPSPNPNSNNTQSNSSNNPSIKNKLQMPPKPPQPIKTTNPSSYHAISNPSP